MWNRLRENLLAVPRMLLLPGKGSPTKLPRRASLTIYRTPWLTKVDSGKANRAHVSIRNIPPQTLLYRDSHPCNMYRVNINSSTWYGNSQDHTKQILPKAVSNITTQWRKWISTNTFRRISINLVLAVGRRASLKQHLLIKFLISSRIITLSMSKARPGRQGDVRSRTLLVGRGRRHRLLLDSCRHSKVACCLCSSLW